LKAISWEIDQTKIPVDPKERKDAWSLLTAVVRQDIEKGIVKDWGAFVGETKGYSINKGTELEVMNTLQQFMPYCTFTVHPIAAEGQANEMIKALPG
jgi:hypothetical protein